MPAALPLPGKSCARSYQRRIDLPPFRQLGTSKVGKKTCEIPAQTVATIISFKSTISHGCSFKSGRDKSSYSCTAPHLQMWWTALIQMWDWCSGSYLLSFSLIRLESAENGQNTELNATQCRKLQVLNVNAKFQILTANFI